MRPRRLRVLMAVIALLGWAAIAVQLVLTVRMVRDNGRSLGAGVALYLAYFTILTNLLCAVAVSFPLLAPHSRPAGFFTRPSVITGATAAILLVGVAYNAFLRQYDHPHGAGVLTNAQLHLLMPLLFTLYWWYAVPAGSIGWGDIPTWLVYPVLYMGYMLLRGAWTGHYPYPILDVRRLGYGGVLLHGAGLLLLTTLTGVLLTALKRPRAPAPQP